MLSLLVGALLAKKPPPPPPPRSSAGSKGSPNFNLFPDDPRLRFQGASALSLSHEAAFFSRPSLEPSPSPHPGVSLSFRTDAAKIFAVIDYVATSACSMRCPTLPSGGCYTARPCPNQCEVRLEVDGVERERPPSHTTLSGLPLVRGDRPDDDVVVARNANGGAAGGPRGFLGEVKVWIADGGRETDDGAVHNYTLRMPWGAPVVFKRLHLEAAAAGARRPALRLIPDAPTVRYVALGDSITAGMCSRGAAYPELLAALNPGWAGINLGAPGVRADMGLAAAVVAAKPDIVTVMIGAADWVRHSRAASVGAARRAPTFTRADRPRAASPLLPQVFCDRPLMQPATSLLARLRSDLGPNLPIVLISPLASHREEKRCDGPIAATPQDLRMQLASAVEVRALPACARRAAGCP